MYRHNGGVIGSRINESGSGIILSVELPRGRYNGGIIDGTDRLTANNSLNVGKFSGVWNNSGMTFVTQSIDVITYVDNSYIDDPPPYEQFTETGRTAAGSGEWYPNASSCGTAMWPGGDRRTSADAHSWTYFGQSNCDPWVYTIYTVQGYYTTIDPPPVYVEQIDEVVTTAIHDIWTYYG